MCDFNAVEKSSLGDFVMLESTSLAREARVIVVGGGLAGLTVSNTVLQHGGCVVLLEKARSFGGNSAKTVEGISGARTSAQSTHSIDDSVELFEEDATRDDVQRPELVKLLCEKSGEALQWLRDKFEIELPSIQKLGGHSVPRVHHSSVGSLGLVLTSELTKVLLERAKDQSSKVEVRKEARVRRLLSSDDGACIGCAYTVPGGCEHLEYGPVVLCTGGFTANFAQDSLLARWRPDLLHLPTSSCEHCVGDGITMAKAFRGRSIDLEWIQLHPLGLVKSDDKHAKVKILASDALLGYGGLLLNAEGDRFSSELDQVDSIARQMWKTAAPLWLVLNAATVANTAQYCKHYVNRGLMKNYSSGGALAKAMGIALGKLETTLEANYQEMKQQRLSNGIDGSLNAIPGTAVRSESFYAAVVTPVINYCTGGLEVNTDSNVLSEDGNPITGLYAAGEVAGGIQGRRHLTGNSLLECVVFGRIAGNASFIDLKNLSDRVLEPSREAKHNVPQALLASVATTAETNASDQVSREDVGRESAVVEAGSKAVSVKLRRLLESRLTESTLQAALVEAQKSGGDLTAVVENLCQNICGSTLGSDGRPLLELTLRDPARSNSGKPRLPTKVARTVIPATGATCADVPLTCVHCRLPLTLEVLRGSSPLNVDTSLGQADSEAEGQNAYATLLYGSGLEYFLGALVIGHSLKATGSTVDRLLLHTDDVPTPYLRVLQQLWTLRRVQYLEGTKKLYKKWNQSRFKAVFTKLQALSCQEYNKVLMLDLDMLIRSNIEDLFHLRTPAAMKRSSGRGQPPHGEAFDARDLWRTDGEDMCSGINAGVMLLQPDARIYKRMLSEIRDPNHPEHIGTFGPEQDYLSRFYCVFLSGTWTHIHAKYNYQLQLPDDYVSKDHRELDVQRDVVVAHYSGPRVKPWELSREPLGVDGLRRLLFDDTVRASFARVFSSPAATNAPPKERIMDGVRVVESSDPKALPESCQDVMWEWVLALRRCSDELYKEHDIDILSVAESVATDAKTQ